MSDFVEVEISGGVSLGKLLTLHGLLPGTTNGKLGGPTSLRPPMDSTNEAETKIGHSGGEKDEYPARFQTVGLGEHKTPQTFGDTYLKCMYYTGLVVLKPGHGKNGPKLFSYVQQSIFWILALLSIFYAVLFTLIQLSWFLRDKSKTYLVDLIYSFECLAISLYALILFGFKGQKLLNVLAEIKTYITHVNVEGSYVVRFHHAAIVVTLSSLAFAAGKACLSFGDNGEWSFHSVVEQKAALWDYVGFSANEPVNSTTNETVTVAFQGKQANVTTATYLLGCLTLFSQVSSYLQADAIQNLLMIHAVLLDIIISAFLAEITDSTTVSLRDTNDFDSSRFDGQWNKYENLKKVLELANHVYDTLLRLSHVRNLFLFGYFVASLLVENGSLLYLMTIFYAMAKTAYLYYISSKSSKTNAAVRKWIKLSSNSNGQITAGGKTFNMTSLLDDLNEEQIGFGKGSFLISEGFVFRFVGLVASLSIFLVDDANGNEYRF